MKRFALLLTLALSACTVHSTPTKPAVPDRAFAVDVPTTAGTIAVDGWNCDTHNPDWCGKPLPIVDQGGFGHVDFPALAGDAPAMNLHVRAEGYQPLDCVASVPPGNATAAIGVPLAGNRYQPEGCPDHLDPIAPAGRRGLVFPDGKAVRDDLGYFHPLGITFFWAMQGMRAEPERLQQNLDFLARYHFDYARILAEVDWQGREIDPSWPDYDELLGRVIDAFWSKGMRVEITALGSNAYPDKVGLAHRIAAVTKARPGRVIDIEVANESGCNRISVDDMKAMARIFLAEAGVPLVALSSGCGDAADVEAAAVEVGATMRVVHTDRGAGDGGWRMVRQAFDFKDIPGVVSSNEPPGPESSVNTLADPRQLALMRSLGAMEGGALFVLHVGDMVTGLVDPAHNRQANLWQAVCNDPRYTPEAPCPGIDQVMRAVRGVDAYLPDGVENWRPKSAGNITIPPQAMRPDQAGWDGVTGDTVNRAYAVFDGLRFVQVLLGIRGTAHLTVAVPGASHCLIDWFDPGNNDKHTTSLDAGFRWDEPGAPDGSAGRLLNGTCQ